MRAMLRRARREPWLIALAAMPALVPPAIVVPLAMLGFHAEWCQVCSGVFAAPIVFVLMFCFVFGDRRPGEPDRSGDPAPSPEAPAD